MLRFILWTFIVLAVIALVLVVVYMLQSQFRNNAISESASLKIVTTGTNRDAPENLENKRWKEIINDIEMKCVKKQDFHMHTATKTASSPSMYIYSGLPKGLSSANAVIVLYSSGDFAGFLTDYPQLRQRLPFSGVFSLKMPLDSVREGLFTNVPVVGFDYPTHSPRLLNFGQAQDQQVLTKVFDQLCSAYPHARIVLMGECMGGLRVFNWLPTLSDEKKSHIAAIIYMYPIRQMSCIFENWDVAKPIRTTCHSIVKKCLKNYTEEDKYDGWFMNQPVAKFPSCPMFLATALDDPLASKAELTAIAEKFQHHSQPLQVYETTTKMPHGKLRKDKGFIEATKKFMSLLLDR